MVRAEVGVSSEVHKFRQLVAYGERSGGFVSGVAGRSGEQSLAPNVPCSKNGESPWKKVRFSDDLDSKPSINIKI